MKVLNTVAHIKQGDLLVFNQVFYQYHERLYFYVLNKTKSSFSAEEVVQITFIKLWQNRHSLNEDISLDAQIFRIAKTTLIDQLRKVDSSEKLLSVLKQSNEGFAVNKGTSNLEKQELQQKLQKLFSIMPPMRRKVFEMSRLDGLTHKEIAERLSISEKTVENHINHALKQIRNNFPVVLILLYYYN